MPVEHIERAAPEGGATNPFNDSVRMDALEEIEREILCHSIIRHPFLENLSAGKYTKDQIRVWISQQFYFSTQFPRCLAALYARIEDFEASKALVDFLSIEHWGSKSKSAHWKQFSRTLEFFNLNIDDQRRNEALPETREYLDYRLTLCLQRSVEEALGAIGFGHELINEKIFQEYFTGIAKVADIPEEALTYFRVHVRDEPDDYRVLKRLMLIKAENFAAIDRLRKGAEDVLRARYVFFDRVCERLASV